MQKLGHILVLHHTLFHILLHTILHTILHSILHTILHCFQDRHKGVSHLIEIENPNRAIKKNKKLNSLDTEGGARSQPQLSRKER